MCLHTSITYIYIYIYIYIRAACQRHETTQVVGLHFWRAPSPPYGIMCGVSCLVVMMISLMNMTTIIGSGMHVRYMMTGIGSVEPTHRCTPFSRCVWFPPIPASDDSYELF